MSIYHTSGTWRKSNAFPGYLLALVLALLLVSSCNSTLPSQTPTPSSTPFFDVNGCSSRSSTPITLTMYYGSEKQEWIKSAVNDFNALHISACDGPIYVNATAYGSGDSMQRILNGERPDIWSPAGRIWLNLLNAKWQSTHGNTGPLVSTTSLDSPSLVLSPVVIAMWKSMVTALVEKLHKPQNQLGWSDIETLATASQGWAAYGHPEWRKFQFAHTPLTSSNSGLDTVIAEYYAALGKQSDLSLSDVKSSRAQNFVVGIERSLIDYGENVGNQYGDSTGFLAEKMCQGGQSFLSAAALYENLVVEMNEKKLSSACPEPVVAIYPKEGTFYSDHPFAIPLWVSSAKRTSALAFRNFLLTSDQQKKALSYGFRPTDLSVPITSRLDPKYGINPVIGTAILQIPSLDVIQTIQANWSQLNHRVAVMLLLDTSGSMNYLVNGTTKIDTAKQSLKQLIGLPSSLNDSDLVGLATFDTDMHILFQMAPLGANRQQMLKMIDGITASGATRLYDSIADQVQMFNALSTNYLKAVVVFSDGVDTVSQLSLAQLLKKITPTDPRVDKEVRVFTITYGDSSYIDKDGLRKIANVTGGQEYSSTSQDIQQMYRQMSQSF